MPPDEDAYRRLRDEALRHRCAFERALLARCAACGQASPVLVAEREAIGCASAPASERCRAYRDRLRTSARFALRIDETGPLPFGKAIRLQCGGLIGLRDSLDEGATQATAEAAGARPAAVADVAALIALALERFGELDALPYSRIIRSVIRYEPRPRARR